MFISCPRKWYVQQLILCNIVKCDGCFIYITLTVFPFRLLTLQCSTTVVPKWVLTFSAAPTVGASTKYGIASCVVVSTISSVSSFDGESVKGEEKSCQKFRGNMSNGSPSFGLRTETFGVRSFRVIINKCSYALKRYINVEMYLKSKCPIPRVYNPCVNLYELSAPFIPNLRWFMSLLKGFLSAFNSLFERYMISY